MKKLIMLSQTGQTIIIKGTRLKQLWPVEYQFIFSSRDSRDARQ